VVNPPDNHPANPRVGLRYLQVRQYITIWSPIYWTLQW
jgi:hypothetical protein